MMMMHVRAVPVVMAAHMVAAMPVMVATHMMMTVVTMMVAILHLGRQTFTGALDLRRNAGIVERDRVGLLRRRCHKQQACNGGEAKKLLYVHVFSPGFRAHRLAARAAMGSSPMQETLGLRR
jgi:hypothetical protein